MNRMEKRPRPDWGTEAANGQFTHAHATPPPPASVGHPPEAAADRYLKAAAELPLQAAPTSGAGPPRIAA